MYENSVNYYQQFFIFWNSRTWWWSSHTQTHTQRSLSSNRIFFLWCAFQVDGMRTKEQSSIYLFINFIFIIIFFGSLRLPTRTTYLITQQDIPNIWNCLFNKCIFSCYIFSLFIDWTQYLNGILSPCFTRFIIKKEKKNYYYERWNIWMFLVLSSLLNYTKNIHLLSFLLFLST